LTRPLLSNLHDYRVILGWLGLFFFFFCSFLSNFLLPNILFQVVMILKKYLFTILLLFFLSSGLIRTNLLNLIGATTRDIDFSYLFEMHLWHLDIVSYKKNVDPQRNACPYLVIPYTKRDQHFIVDSHNEILILPLGKQISMA